MLKLPTLITHKNLLISQNVLYRGPLLEEPFLSLGRFGVLVLLIVKISDFQISDKYRFCSLVVASVVRNVYVCCKTSR